MDFRSVPRFANLSKNACHLPFRSLASIAPGLRKMVLCDFRSLSTFFLRGNLSTRNTALDSIVTVVTVVEREY